MRASGGGSSASSGWPCTASTASALVCCCEAAGGEDNRLCYGMTWGIPTREPVVFTRLQGTQTGPSMPTTWIRTHSDRGPTPVMAAHVPFGRIVTALYSMPGPDLAKTARGWMSTAGCAAISGAVTRLTLTKEPSTCVM